MPNFALDLEDMAGDDDLSAVLDGEEPAPKSAQGLWDVRGHDAMPECGGRTGGLRPRRVAGLRVRVSERLQAAGRVVVASLTCRPYPTA